MKIFCNAFELPMVRHCSCESCNLFLLDNYSHFVAILSQTATCKTTYMTLTPNLQKFIDAQQRDYDIALAEIKQGRKRSHWMWYIFPQIQGLGFSETSKYYAIKDKEEANAFLKHPLLGTRLIQISQALLWLPDKDAGNIFGYPDDLKLKSSMTLFASLPHADPVFQSVLNKFFNGKKDEKTLQILNRQS